MRWLYAYVVITALALTGVATYSGWRRGRREALDKDDEFMAVLLAFTWPVMVPFGLFLLAVFGFWRLLQLPGAVLAARSLRRSAAPPNTEQGRGDR